MLGINTRNNFKDKIDYKESYKDFKSNISDIKPPQNNDSSSNKVFDINQSIKQRQIGNNLYQKILEKYKLKRSELTELQLDDLISKYNIGKENSNMTGFVSELKNIIKNNIHQSQIAKDINVNEPIKEKDYYISIDSDDRNKEKWNNANLFQISFGTSSNVLLNEDNTSLQSGIISRTFINIKEIEIMDIILKPKDKLLNGYILLNIDELGGNILGTNSNLSNSIVILSNYNLLNNDYYHYSINRRKYFSPPIDINKLTIKFIYNNGDLVELNNCSINIRIKSI